MAAPNPGLFISFEGTEGGGKSTQIQRLQKRLQQAGLTVRPVREPGGTPIGEEIRHTLKSSPANTAMTAQAELLLMCASRAQLVREIIRPALGSGEIVVCDRFLDSTEVYQGYGRGLDLEWIQAVNAFAVGETLPDLTLLLAIPLELSEKRRQARGSQGRDRMEQSDRAFFERVEQGYLAVAARQPDRIRVLDASEPVEVVADAIWDHVESMLTKRGVRLG